MIGLTREELEAQSVLFLLAGYDTTASSIGFLLYNMALNPDCQEKLYQEIKQACGDKVPALISTVLPALISTVLPALISTVLPALISTEPFIRLFILSYIRTHIKRRI